MNFTIYSPEPLSDVYCFGLNFNISKLGYCIKVDVIRSVIVVVIVYIHNYYCQRDEVLN